MSNSGKNIRIWFILLTGLIILLHSVIPHHHHLDLYIAHFDGDNRSVETSGESSGEAKTHCHAFNVIVSKTEQSLSFYSGSESNFIALLISEFCSIQADNKAELTSLFIRNIVTIKQYFSSEISFRGPPSLA